MISPLKEILNFWGWDILKSPKSLSKGQKTNKKHKAKTSNYMNTKVNAIRSIPNKRLKEMTFSIKKMRKINF